MDYHIIVTFTVPVATEEERVWINDTLKNPPDDLRMADMEDGEPTTLGFQWEMRDEHLWIYEEMNANTCQIVEFLKLYLKQPCCKHTALGFQFAYTGSKLRPDAYGGGAIRIRKTDNAPPEDEGLEVENFETNWFLEDWSIP